MEFKVGDKVKCVKENGNVKVGEVVEVSKFYENSDSNKSNTGHDKATIFISGTNLEGDGFTNKHVYQKYFELIPNETNSMSNKKMEKKIYEVLTANKKTGETKKEMVVADDEQSAILKAFGVDAENTYIKVKEEGKYTEEKPVQAVIVKEEKK